MTIPLTIAAMHAIREHMATAHIRSPLGGWTIDWMTEGAVRDDESISELLISELSLMP